MMWWWGGGWWWLVGALFVVFCMAMMGRMMSHRGWGHGGSPGSRRSGTDAQDILAARFARGEISVDEFEQRTRVLERRTPADDGVRPGVPGAP